MLCPKSLAMFPVASRFDNYISRFLDSPHPEFELLEARWQPNILFLSKKVVS